MIHCPREGATIFAPGDELFQVRTVEILMLLLPQAEQMDGSSANDFEGHTVDRKFRGERLAVEC